MLRTAPAPGPDAFAAFYCELEQPVIGLFMKATRGQADLAADLTAETFASALESREAFDPRCARSRTTFEVPQLVLDEESLAAIERLCQEGGEAMLALASLPDEQRQAVNARIVEELEYAEIAGELRCSEAVVRQRVSRGLRTLRRKLGD